MTLDKQKGRFELFEAMTTEEVKGEIFKLFGTDPKIQQVIYKGKLLKDGENLSKFGSVFSDTIFVKRNMKGGGKKGGVIKKDKHDRTKRAVIFS